MLWRRNAARSRAAGNSGSEGAVLTGWVPRDPRNQKWNVTSELGSDTQGSDGLEDSNSLELTTAKIGADRWDRAIGRINVEST